MLSRETLILDHKPIEGAIRTWDITAAMAEQEGGHSFGMMPHIFKAQVFRSFILLIDTGTPYEQAPYQQYECKYVFLDRHQTIAFLTTSQRRQGLYALHGCIRYSCIYEASNEHCP